MTDDKTGTSEGDRRSTDRRQSNQSFEGEDRRKEDRRSGEDRRKNPRN